MLTSECCPCFVKVVEFCDNSGNPSTQHNPHHNTPQNRLCNNRSVWEVLEKHKDFSNFVSPSGERQAKKDTDLQPNIKAIFLRIDW